MSAFVSQLTPKNIKAIASTIHIPDETLKILNGIKRRNDAAIPIPQTLYIMFLIFFFLLSILSPLVNKKNELNASKQKNAIAQALCIPPLTALGIWNVPTSDKLVDAQGNKQIPRANKPANVQTMSSINSYPL